MHRFNLLLSAIVALVLAYVGFSLFQQDGIAENIRPFILPVVLIYYFSKGYDRSSYFFYFLLFYTLGDLLGLPYSFPEISETWDTILYFSCNTLYVISYLCLILEILSTIDLKKMMAKYAFQSIILAALGIYCVVLVTDVAIQSEFLVSIPDYIMEFVYNMVIMTLLVVALVNYLYRDGAKSMNLLMGSLCVVFSEVIQVAYFYVADEFLLGISYIVLIIVAFVFFWLQIKMVYTETKMIQTEEKASITEENGSITEANA